MNQPMMPFAGAQRVPSAKLDLYIRRNFLSAEECAAVIAMIDARRRPSTIADDMGDPLFRTSETCDLDMADPLTKTIDQRIADFLALGLIVGEPMQGQRYAPGQEFKLHTDYFEPNGADYQAHCGVSGQRTWTAMIYLNEPEAGGATRFKVIDKIVRPETGKMLCWNNQLATGQPNGATLHQGMKVRKGVKYVITKWFRERPWAG
ncbi:MAG: prolyl hydroxylase family protein [Sphingomonadaceae bacterium]